MLGNDGLLSQTDEDEDSTDANVVGDAVIVDGEWTTPGDPGDSNESGVIGDGVGDNPFVRIYEEHRCNPHEDTASDCATNGYIMINPSNPDDPDDPDEPEVRPVTIEDVQRFAPDAPNIVVEPEGWGLVGKPVNVFSDSGEQTTQGEILDMPVTIRWIPVSITIDYGDGTVVTSDDQGAAWGDAEYMSETVTSHIYREPGDYVISAEIEYAPIVEIDGLEVVVQGTVSTATNDVPISIYWVKTRLTRGDCEAFPDDPGCPA